MSYAKIHLDVPLNGPFDYRTNGLSVVKGSLVEVPFRNKKQVGIVIDVSENTNVETRRIKGISSIIDVAPLSSDYITLCRFVSEYYCFELGRCLFVGLPRSIRMNRLGKEYLENVYSLTVSGRLEIAGTLDARARGKRRLYEHLLSNEQTVLADARRIYSNASKQLTNWIQSGWIKVQQRDLHEFMKIDRAISVTPTKLGLTESQIRSVDSISLDLTGAHIWVLQGVTGSGKTEVYFELMERALQSKKQVLMLVPEINLTPQLKDRLQRRFPSERIVTLNSGLGDSNRFLAWEQARHGVASIILGTRLAVFTPLKQLGLIIVDEEHDTSYKQIEGVRYHARDLAVYLSHLKNIPVVLGSATPSLETYHNVLRERYKRTVLSDRPSGSLPTVELIRVPRLESHTLSPQVIHAMQSKIDDGEQVLVFINRRGYAPALFCSSCQWSVSCHRCSAALTLHKRPDHVRCHHCGYQGRVPSRCSDCGNQDLLDLGHGTQRLEEEVAARFRHARVIRVDSDSTSRKGSFEAMRQSIDQTQVDIVIGTQMLSKGHDFSNINLVVILGTDQALYSGDFRATERQFQQMLQVSGRAGRGSSRGQVLLQTEFPDHPIYQHLIRHSYDDFAIDALKERELSDFPPYSYQAILRASSPSSNSVENFLNRARLCALDLKSEAIDVYDAVPAPIHKLAGLIRGQLLVQSTQRKPLRIFLRRWMKEISNLNESGVRFVLDVDPIDV